MNGSQLPPKTTRRKQKRYRPPTPAPPPPLPPPLYSGAASRTSGAGDDDAAGVVGLGGRGARARAAHHARAAALVRGCQHIRVRWSEGNDEEMGRKQQASHHSTIAGTALANTTTAEVGNRPHHNGLRKQLTRIRAHLTR